MCAAAAAAAAATAEASAGQSSLAPPLPLFLSFARALSLFYCISLLRALACKGLL